MKAGDVVDRYLLLKKLGFGGMGGVWIAFDPDCDDLVAVKTLFEEYTDDELYVRRFQREVTLLEKLRHPNIVGFRGSGRTDRTYYLALEFIRGGDLSDSLKANGRFTVADTLSTMTEITRALGYAHGQGVIHRDIKPSNIMISVESKIAKILDFGVAHAEDPNLMTATGDVVGTFLYAAPEQNQGKQVDERSDLYALGLTFHEMLTGQRVLTGATHQEVTACQLTVPIPAPSSRNPAVPQQIDRIVEKLLRVEADKRYQNCDELLVDLEAFQNNPQEFAKDRRSIYEYPELVPDFKLAQRALRKERYEEAVEMAEVLVGKAPRAAEVHVLMGQAQRGKGLPFNAVNAFKRAITFERGNILHHMELATTYEQMDMANAAREIYQTVLLMEPNSSKAKERMDALEARESTSGHGAKPSSRSSGATDPLRKSLHGRIPIQNRPEIPAPPEGLEAPPPRETLPDTRSSDLEEQNAEEEQETLPTSEESPATDVGRWIRKDLDRALPPPVSLVFSVGGSFLLWPVGFWNLGLRLYAMVLLLIEVSLLSGLSFFQRSPMWVPPDFLGNSVMTWAAAHPGESAWYAALTCALLWLLGGIMVCMEVYSAVRNLEQQAFVIEVDKGEKTLLLNAGSRRGFTKGDRLMVFQETPRRSGKGLLIGEVKLVEVLENEAAGPFQGAGDVFARVGDFVTSPVAVHEGWIDPTKTGFHAFRPRTRGKKKSR
jgi:tetratricopeptide (TPR) repeat protein